MTTTPFDPLSGSGFEAPLTTVPDLRNFDPSGAEGASRYRHSFENDRHLDILLVTKPSPTLVVSLHGAIDRKKYELPRFERFRSLNKFSVSALYLGDPSLWSGPDLELAWHTGWDDTDMYPIYADLIQLIASKIGARNIVLNGGSGGGFAALQVSALIPDSVAVVYNPQTSIYSYMHPKWPLMPQKRYIRNVWPSLVNEDIAKFDFTQDWTIPMGDRLSAVRTYSKPRKNRVLYMINMQDLHHVEDHYKPFARAMEAAPDRLKTIEYDGGSGHNPTTFDQFKEGLTVAGEWAGFHID